MPSLANVAVPHLIEISKQSMYNQKEKHLFYYLTNLLYADTLGFMV